MVYKKLYTDFNFYKRVFFYGEIANNKSFIRYAIVTETLNLNIPKCNRLGSSHGVRNSIVESDRLKREILTENYSFFLTINYSTPYEPS